MVIVQMTVVLLDHARVGVAKVLGDDRQGDARLDRQTCPCMSELVKAYRRINVRTLASLQHRPELVTRLPLTPEHRRIAVASGDKIVKERSTIIGQNHMAAVARLAETDIKLPVVRIVV